jgi:hypothetical protein
MKLRNSIAPPGGLPAGVLIFDAGANNRLRTWFGFLSRANKPAREYTRTSGRTGQ